MTYEAQKNNSAVESGYDGNADPWDLLYQIIDSVNISDSSQAGSEKLTDGLVGLEGLL